GRGERRGRAVIQTYMPENETLTLAKSQDYVSFYNEEIKIRRELNFPPFCDIVSILLTGEDEHTLSEYARSLKTSIDTVMTKEIDGNFEILGPAKAIIPKINSKYRQRIWIKCKMGERTQNILNRLRTYHIKNANNINMMIETNPYNTL
ncbi:MAG: primosomal protein N', partial [Clostridia bacterium]|nr:primosomal protein N' [Clostridia bacterium]